MVSLIKELLDWQQLSPTQFADRIGIGRPVISHILSERNKPSLEVIKSIKVAFPEVSTDWLLTGSGPMLAAVTTEAAGPQPAIASTPVPSPDPANPAPIAPSSTAPAAIEDSALTTTGAASPVTPALDGPREASGAVPAPPPEPVVAPPTAAQAAPPTRFRASKVASPAPAASEPAAARPTGVLLPGLAPAPGPRHPAETAAAPADLAPVPPLAAQSAATPPAGQLVQPLAAEAAALATSLAEPGKAIRRIVIFYRDGSFADYQPE